MSHILKTYLRLVDLLFIVTSIMGVCNCSLFCCMLLYVHSSFAIILMRMRELVALLSLSSWCLMIVVWLFLAVPWICLQFVIVVFSDHTHYFWNTNFSFILDWGCSSLAKWLPMVCRLQRKLQISAMTLVKCQGQICLKSVFRILTWIILSDGQCLYMYLAQFFRLIPQTPQGV